MEASSFSVFICSVVAATLGTLTGFGIGLGFILTLSLLTPTILAPVSSDEHLQWVIAMVGVLTCGTTACERYKNIPIRWLAHLVAPTVFLSPLGVVLALGFETSTLQQIFALVFFVAGSQQLWTKWSNDDLKSPETTPREGAADMLTAEPQERVLLVCAGAASGFLGGLSGMGGPPMQVYIVARPVGMAEARAGISAYFTLIYVVNLATLVSARIHSTRADDDVLIDLLLAAAIGVVVGCIAGRLLLQLKPDAELIYTTITALLFISCAETWATALATAVQVDASPAMHLLMLTLVGTWVYGLSAVHSRRKSSGEVSCCCRRRPDLALH